MLPNGSKLIPADSKDKINVSDILTMMKLIAFIFVAVIAALTLASLLKK